MEIDTNKYYCVLTVPCVFIASQSTVQMLVTCPRPAATATDMATVCVDMMLHCRVASDKQTQIHIDLSTVRMLATHPRPYPTTSHSAKVCR